MKKTMNETEKKSGKQMAIPKPCITPKLLKSLRIILRYSRLV